MSNTSKQRFIWTGLIFLGMLLGPWWLWFGLALVVSTFFLNYFEFVLVAALYDLIYFSFSASVNLLHLLSFWALAAYVILHFVRSYTRFRKF